MSSSEIFRSLELAEFEASRVHKLTSHCKNMEDWYIFYSLRKEDWLILKLFNNYVKYDQELH